MMSLWDALRMNMMISYQELVRTFPKAFPITPEQIEIRELKKKIQRIEMENEILKNCPWVKPRPESQKLPGKVGRLI